MVATSEAVDLNVGPALGFGIRAITVEPPSHRKAEDLVKSTLGKFDHGYAVVCANTRRRNPLELGHIEPVVSTPELCFLISQPASARVAEEILVSRV